MIQSKRFLVRWSLVGLAITMFIAFMAQSAQAYEWTREGSTFEALKIKEESISGTASGVFKLEVPGRNMVIKCESTTVSGALSQGGTGTLTSELSKCKVTTIKGEEFSSCTVGTPLVSKAKAEQVEVKGVIYYKLVPLEKAFTTVKISGGECVLSPKTEVTGSVAAAFKGTEEVEQSLTFSETAAAEVKTKLLYGSFAASAGGTLKGALSGVSKGKKWGPTSVSICKAKPTETEGTLVCPKGEAYSGKFEAKLETGSKATFESTEAPTGTISCNEVNIEGEINSGGSGTISTETYHSGKGGPCTSTLEGNPTVEVEFTELPFKFTTVFNQVAAPQGQVQPPPVRFANFTIGGMTCVYRVLMPNWAWTNGPPPGWIFQQGYELVMGVVPPCPPTMIQNTFVPPAPPGGAGLYVARR